MIPGSLPTLTVVATLLGIGCADGKATEVQEKAIVPVSGEEIREVPEPAVLLISSLGVLGLLLRRTL